MPTFLSATNLADLTGTSLATAQKWGESGVYPYHRNEKGKKGFYMEELADVEPVRMMLDTNWDEEFHVAPLRDYTSVELFAGAGGLALGMHLAGFRHVLLNEMDAMACQTLRRNHPEWNVLEGDIHQVDFSPLRGKVDFLSGGFPCQAEGGDWRDLPVEEQKEYMGGSFYLGGGKTGMARRLSMDEPSLTLTCAPAQKQTERCHPTETRPLTVREYARIQTFPDNWVFEGNMGDQYKQIGNAVPVNLAFAIGRSLIRLFNDIDAQNPEKSQFEEADKAAHGMLPPELFEIDMFDLHEQYPKDISIINNPLVRKKRINNSSLDDSKNVLVCLVPDKYIVPYSTQNAKAYFTGKKFPSTVKLNKLYYFMPYTKGKGIRDLYQIEVARVGTKHEFVETADENDFRLVFEIKFVKQLFNDYKPIKLMIWRTFTDTNLRAILAM